MQCSAVWCGTIAYEKGIRNEVVSGGREREREKCAINFRRASHMKQGNGSCSDSDSDSDMKRYVSR